MAESAPTFIPGLHFFCDHRCWRCAMSHRCQVAMRLAEMPARRRRPMTGPAGRVAEVVMASLYVTVEQVGVVTGLAPDAPAAPGAEPPDPHTDTRKAAERDPLVMRAKDYASGSLRVLQVLRPRLGRGGDAVAIDAAERLEETCLTVASKVHRAVSSALQVEPGPADLQDDANGSAKVALLLIEESRQAWRELMHPGRAVADGAPARFVATLDVLEAGLHERFPRALEFVRPGFDTEGDGVAQALLNASSATRN